MTELTAELSAKLRQLRGWMAEHRPLVVAYSGGVDSSLVLRVAREGLGGDVRAVLAVSASLPANERMQALELASSIGVEIHQLATSETEDAAYQRNGVDRCYHCKDHVYGAIRVLAANLGVAHIADGMNQDDTLDVRPGRAAAREKGIHSPLHELGFNKQEVRAAARHLGLPNWDKPAAACLASRVPYGTVVTGELLTKIEQAECLLHEMGFPELRVRHHDVLARIEVPLAELARVLLKREEVAMALRKLGYLYVTLDLDGLMSGSMNRVLPARMLNQLS